MPDYQSLLLVSFGGPESREDVLPFLHNVLKGKNVPEARMLQVAEHYYKYDGYSPINDQNRELISAIQQDFAANQLDLPIYWGNRNWHPMLPDTLAEMKRAGIGKSLAFFTSGYSCYSGCRQYRENIQEACAAIGAGAPEVHKLRMFYNHPRFIEACAARVREACADHDADLGAATMLFTAHSIPIAMADASNYFKQLEESSRLVAEECGARNWKLVFQSRSGPPSQPWLEPDVCDYMEVLAQEGVNEVVIMPIGFISDHMEVIYDLDVEAREKADELGMKLTRASTVGVHPSFVTMIRELVLERMQGGPQPAIGRFGPSHDVCPVDCCLPSPKSVEA